MNLSKTKCLLPVVIFTAAVPTAALAQSSNALSGLYACETVTDKNAQLDCFLRETAKLRGAEAPANAAPAKVSGINKTIAETPLALPAQPKAVEKTAETAVVDEEAFIPIPKDTTPKKRTLTIESTTTYGRNKYVRFHMKNGEVWQQIEAGYIRLGRGNPDKLTLKKASLGSFLGRVNDKGNTFRIKRVK